MATTATARPLGQGVYVDDGTTIGTVPGVVLISPTTGLPYSATGGGGGGSSDTTEATQILVKNAVVATADATGNKSDARATWYDATASLGSLIKLAIAAFVGAGSRTYTYTAGQLTSEAWTLFGTTRTKTYTYTGGVLTGESDWV